VFKVEVCSWGRGLGRDAVKGNGERGLWERREIPSGVRDKAAAEKNLLHFI